MGILENDTVRSPLAPITDANRKTLEAIIKSIGPVAKGRPARSRRTARPTANEARLHNR